MHLLSLFSYTACLCLFFPLLLPFWHGPYFAPFLILCFYQRSLIHSLWWSLLSGLIIDFFCADTRLGMHAFNYCLVTLCLYRYQFRFFEDRFSTLPIMTFGFSLLSATIQIGLFYLIGKSFSLSWTWVIQDLLMIPFQTAIYALLAFTIPSLLMNHLKREYVRYKLRKS